MNTSDTLVRKAQQYLRSAAVLLETGDYDSTASRAYFAMFYMAQALLLREKQSLPSGAGIRAEFVRQFVENGPLPERAEVALNRGYELQEMADYSQEFAVSENDAERVLQEAEAFVYSITRMLRPGQDAGGVKQATQEKEERSTEEPEAESSGTPEGR